MWEKIIDSCGLSYDWRTYIEVILVEEHSIRVSAEQQDVGRMVVFPIFCQIVLATAQSWLKVCAFTVAAESNESHKRALGIIFILGDKLSCRNLKWLDESKICLFFWKVNVCVCLFAREDVMTWQTQWVSFFRQIEIRQLKSASVHFISEYLL